MINSRKQVIAKLNTLEEELNEHQHKIVEHKAYLEKIMSSKMMGLMVLMVPAFITGWKAAKMLTKQKPMVAAAKPRRIKHHTAKLVKFGLVSTMNHFRKKFGF